MGQQRERLVAASVGLLLAAAAIVLAPGATQRRSTPDADAAPGPRLPSAAPRVAWTVPVGPRGQTSSILFAEGSVWVSLYEVTEDPSRHLELVVRLDPHTGSQLARIEAPGPGWTFGGGGLAAGFGSIWVTGGVPYEGDQRAVVDRIDPATNSVIATIPLDGRSGADVAIGPDSVWVAAAALDHARVARIDPATNRVVATIALRGDYVRRIAAAGDAVVAAEYVWGERTGPCGVLTSIDPSSNSVLARADVDVNLDCPVPHPISWRGEVWASSSDGLRRVDPRTAELVGESLAFDVGRSPRSFLLPDDDEVWFAAYPGGEGQDPDTLARLDPATGDIEYVEGFEVGAIAAALGPDAIWTLGFEGSVTRIDLR